MKRFLLGLVLLACSAGIFVGCEESYVTYSGPDYVMFSDTLQTVAVQDDETYYDIPVSATTACDYDRTYAVEVVDEGSNAIEGLHYDLESNTITIPAGQLATSVKIKGYFSNFEDTDSIGVKLRLVLPNEKVWDLYGTDTEVVLQKVCPFDINTFIGYAMVTTTFEYASATTRLITSEQDPDDEDGIILKDYLYDGYDIKVSFDHEDPLEPYLDMEEDQVIASTVEAFSGNLWGDDKLRVYQPSAYTSYYNVCQNYILQYLTFYVEDVGTVGTYINVVEWISEEEYNYLKSQGY